MAVARGANETRALAKAPVGKNATGTGSEAVLDRLAAHISDLVGSAALALWLAVDVWLKRRKFVKEHGRSPPLCPCLTRRGRKEYARIAGNSPRSPKGRAGRTGLNDGGAQVTAKQPVRVEKMPEV